MQIKKKMLHAEWIEYLKRENNSKNFDQIKNYYMQRKLRRFIQIDRKKIEEETKAEFVIVHSEMEYNEKLSRNPQKKNIHFLIESKLNQNHFLWQKSSGPISKLNDYLIKQDECAESIDEEEIFHKNNEKVLIISAKPGMGKSLILDRLTQDSSAENFFVKIILNTCKEALKEAKFEKQNSDALDFILKSFLNKSNEQECSLLKLLAKTEKLTLMFDGLDEVNDYQKQFIHLIDALTNDANYRIKKILITTRNHLKEELEDHFKTFSFNLNQFDDDDKKNFLYKYWRNSKLKHQERASSAKLKQLADELITKIESILSADINQLIGIPLQTKMLADIFISKEKDFSKLEIANIAELYNEFTETMIRETFKNRKSIEPSQNQGLFKREKDLFYSDHSKLSALCLFENENQNKHDLKLSEREILDFGIIVNFTLNTKAPTFLHQSFAEFFLAKSSFQKLIEQKIKDADDDKELERILREKKHFLIRKFLNDLIENHQFPQTDSNQKEDLNEEIQNCCGENLISLLKYFIRQKGANLQTKNDFLITASIKGHKEIVVYLLEQGIDANQQNDIEQTALIRASFEGKKEIVQLLLKHKGVDVNHQNKYKRTALMVASSAGHIAPQKRSAAGEIAQLLLEHPEINVNLKDNEQRTALMRASIAGHKQIVELLLQNQSINVNLQDNREWTALIYASRHGHKEIVQLFLDHKDINVNMQDEEGQHALLWASANGDKEIAQLFLDRTDININLQTKRGFSALIEASFQGRTEIVQLLLEQKAIQINQQDIYGYSALMKASAKGYKEIVQMLLKHKDISVNEESNNGETALSWALQGGHNEIAQMLLVSGPIESYQSIIDYENRLIKKTD
jgi:ankyrin repeat protein